MKTVKESSNAYFDELKKRSQKSRIHRSYQLIGLNLAEILQDKKHKSLYIKLAKNGDPSELLKLAKSVAERHQVKNKGAYFMRILYKDKAPGAHRKK